MSRFNNPLDNVRVASPCNADWDQMIGTDRARFCGQCNLNVYNLSSMTRADAEQLIGRTEGRLCVRYYRRADGSVLTNDCPVGLRAVRRRMASVFRALNAAVLTFFAGVGIYEIRSSRSVFSNEVMGAIAVVEPEPEHFTITQGTFAPTPVVDQVLGRAMIIKPPGKVTVRKRAAN